MSWFLFLKPMWLYFSWTYGKFVGLFESIETKLNPPVTLIDLMKKPFTKAYDNVLSVRNLMEQRLIRLNTIVKAVKYSALIFLTLLTIGLIYFLGAKIYNLAYWIITFFVKLFKSLYGLQTEEEEK